MTDKERLEKELGISLGENTILLALVVWLEKKFNERSPRLLTRCDTCALPHHESWVAHPCSNHPHCRGRVMHFENERLRPRGERAE